MPNTNDCLDAFSVQDIHEVLSDKLVAESVPFSRFGRPSIPEAVRDNETLSFRLEVCNLASPVEGTRGKAMNEEQSGLPGRCKGGVVAVCVASLAFDTGISVR